ncbi:MAG: ferrous iron transport protein B [Jiangellales bacterium]
MSSCHQTATASTSIRGGTDTVTVALVGNANVGKSTLFNQLSGARQQLGNWPGTTVEVARAQWHPRDEHGHDLPITILDLPGAASLNPASPDEQLTRDLLLSPDDAARPDVVVAVVDATNLARCLYLIAQLRELPQRLVVAVTMLDVATRRGIVIDAWLLESRLGVSVVAVDPRHRTTSAALADVIASTLTDEPPAPRSHDFDPSDPFAEDDERFTWVQGAMGAVTTGAGHSGITSTDRIDRVATAPVLGPLLFLAVMWLVFQITTVVAAPLQDALDTLVAGPVSDASRTLLGAIGLGGSAIEGFIVDGLVAGVGMLLTFVPLMALMFLLLAVLETSGYLARAAVVTDRAMRAIGLPGRAFLPLIVGFGCNVPAISATRVLPDARQRVMTSLLVPFTACSARLTVFVLVGATFFGSNAGNVVFGMYVLSIVLVIGVGFLLRSVLWRSMGADALVIDLPAYHLPMPRQVAIMTWTRVRAFLRTAGGIIVVTVAAVWLLSAIPAPGSDGSLADVPVEDSLFAATSQAIAPVFEPAGFGDWHATSALMVGFVAKEAVVSSWAQTYAAQEPDDPAAPGELGEQLRADFEVSSGGYLTAAVFAFLTFLLAYTPCVATLAALNREVGRRWMLTSIAISMSTAWLLAVGVFQVGRLLS